MQALGLGKAVQLSSTKWEWYLLDRVVIRVKWDGDYKMFSNDCSIKIKTELKEKNPVVKTIVFGLQGFGKFMFFFFMLIFFFP